MTVVPIIKKLDGIRGLVGDQVKPCLSKLVDDSDADVRFFAQKALTMV